MNKIGIGVPVLAGVLCLFMTACATSHTVEDTIFADGPRGAVSLQRVDDAWFTTAHPISVSPLLLTHVLRGVHVQPTPNDQTTVVRVFSDEEIAYLSPLMSTALSKATKSQLVAFRVTHDTGPGSEMTGGLLFTRGRLLHLWLTHYRASGTRNDSGATLDRQAPNPRGLISRQLRFVPDAAQQSNRNQPPDLINPPPLATLVIDYKMLLAELEPSSGSAQAQIDHGQSLDHTKGDMPPTLPNASGTASPEAPSPPREDTQALKELVREQAIELDALKKDMHTLRRQLSEIEAERHYQPK